LLHVLSSLPGKRTLHLHVLVSVPRKYHKLYPYADKETAPKTYIQEILLLLSEDAALDKSNNQEADESHKKTRFVSAIESFLFTIPSSSTSLLYVSKVDSTGQGQTPSPTQTLVKAFLSYFADPTNRQTDTLWVHLFARSQKQYLFPNSADHPSKRVLNDAQLCQWWKGTLSAVAQTQASPLPQCYYLLPGFTELEALQLLRHNVTLSANKEHPNWQYGDPYSQQRGKFPFGILQSPSISDVIPSFPDDPKSRFLDELFAPSRALRPKSPPRKRAKTSHGEDEEARDTVKTHNKSHPVASLDDYWEMMGFRQECVSNAVTGFFVLIFSSQGAKPFTHPHPEAGHVSNNIIERITQAMLTSHEYSTDQRSLDSTEILETSIRKLCEGLKETTSEQSEQAKSSSEKANDITSLEMYREHIYRRIENNNAPLPSKRGNAGSGNGLGEILQPVTLLAVKKKKKKT